MWLKFNSSPTVTAVKDTHLALYSLPFPAVNICPMDKIKRTEAHEYVAARTNDSYHESELDNFLNVLTLFQHPLYSRMLSYLNNGMEGFLAKLTNINITDFMLKVMPTCDEIFNACFWIGHSYNCCDLFSLQRSEEGFCYSFNSLTSVKNLPCPMHFSTLENDIDTVQSDFDSVLNATDFECKLRRNTAAGSTSGLQIFFKRFNHSERLINASKITGQMAVRVQVFFVNEYPESGMGSIVTAKKGTKLSIMVKPFVTISTDAIKHLPVVERFCYFPDEKHLSVSKVYTQKSCLIECRLDYLQKKCHCRPYYFNMLDNRIQICNSTQLLCIAQHNSELRFYSPPIGNTRGFLLTERKSPMNCSECLPTCHESVYDLDMDYSLDSQPLTRSSYGSVDIFYRNEGAVKYERDVTFGWIDLLVSFGGIAGLFLGFSLLTIIEFVYWGMKFLTYQYIRYSSSRNKISPEY
uniref:Sodium channel protein Nach n=1 Tax=Sipha flava TaxID=143950 RepID=A0A2S2QJY1_9HEMI